MKKLLLLLSLLVTICSCEPSEAIVTNQKQDVAMRRFQAIRHFEYEGHKYISFECGYTSSSSTMGIVHDPDCHCK
jgi:uncharacterized protein YcfL